ncbi:MAG: hypothetical protein ACI9WT_001005 [Flavobacterium sp.]|jgi:hypothetical protein
MKFSCLILLANRTETLYVEDRSEFLIKPRTSKKVSIQIILFHNGNQMLECNTRGLKLS